MSKVKVGVFGGYRGYVAMQQLINDPEAEVVAVCDFTPSMLEDIKKKAEDLGQTHIAFYSDFDEFLQHDMDAVIMANYAHEHAKYGVKVLDSGRHVMSECLLSANLAEAVALVEAVERSGKQYSYAENYCYTPARLEMKRRYQNGDIGTLMYAEGEYLHDCSSLWPAITYGERNHWRNIMASTFYCTHAIGPILYMTGLRPVKVVGFETPNMPFLRNLGSKSGTFGCQMLQLENGAFMKSLNFNIKNPKHSHYQLNGDLGGLINEGDDVLAYTELPGQNCRGKHETYTPTAEFEDAAKTGHGGGDYFTTYYFIRSILGDEEAKKKTINVYQACDMSIPGILAYRSILEGNTPQAVPNFRFKEERDKYRFDTACPFPSAAGDMLQPSCSFGEVEIPDSVFEEVKRKWLAGEEG